MRKKKTNAAFLVATLAISLLLSTIQIWSVLYVVVVVVFFLPDFCFFPWYVLFVVDVVVVVVPPFFLLLLEVLRVVAHILSLKGL